MSSADLPFGRAGITLAVVPADASVGARAYLRLAIAVSMCESSIGDGVVLVGDGNGVGTSASRMVLGMAPSSANVQRLSSEKGTSRASP